MGCGTKCLKVVLVIINIIFFLAGAAVLGAGLWVRFDKTLETFKGANTGLQEFQDALYAAAYVLIAFGAFTFIVGFCGCCGAMKESKCLLGTYILLVVLCLGAEVGGGVYGFINKDTLLEKFDQLATNYLRDNYGVSGTGAGDEAWNSVMQVFNCCGVHGPSDFRGSNFTKGKQGIFVPDVCCVPTANNISIPADRRLCNDDAGLNKTTSPNLFTKGCMDEVEGLIVDNAVLLLGIAGGVAGFELLVIIMSIVFCCNMKDDD